jgi:hypothetical protein
MIRKITMTEEQYDNEISPALSDIANKVAEMGGSMVCSIEFFDRIVGLTNVGVSLESCQAQILSLFASQSNGDVDVLYQKLTETFDISSTVVGKQLSFFSKLESTSADSTKH